MTIAVLAVPAVVSVVATVMGHRRSPGVRYVKTAVTVMLAAIAAVAVARSGAAGAGAASGTATAAAWGASPVSWYFVLALGLAAVADWLLAPVDNSATFVAGLVFFLLAYLTYGVVLIVGAVPLLAAEGGSIPWVVVALALLAAWLQYRTTRTVPRELRGAVIAYVLVATTLLVGGIWTWIAGQTTAALLILGGTVFIYLSDSLIAHNLFRHPLRAEELWIMPTYYLGQLAMTAAILTMAG